MKMRGHRRRVGRCRIHGQGCVLTQEIREDSFSREQERREARREADEHFDAQHNYWRDYLLVFDEYEEIPA